MSKLNVVKEIHRNARINFPRRRVITKDIDDLWQADLIDMKAYAKENRGYKFILVVIDTFSKYSWAYPLKQKTKVEVHNAFMSLFQEGRCPQNLQTDLGTEFYNNDLKKLIDKYNINHYSTFSVKKASIAERFIRTLKSKLFQQFSLQGNFKWVGKVLDDIIFEYNRTYHRTIKCNPIDVNNNTKHKIFKTLACEKLKKKKNKLKIGDYVRISKYKGVFDKGYTPNWSTEIFKIIKVQETLPVTYLIEDVRNQPISGAFYAEELQKTKFPNIYLIEKVLKKKGNKLFVKWLGLSTKENCWINKRNII